MPFVFAVTVILVATALAPARVMIEPFSPLTDLIFVNVKSDKVSVLPLTLNIAYRLLPEIVTDSDPDPDGPVMVKSSVIAGKSEVRVMVPSKFEANTILSIVAELFALLIPDLKDPEVPSSASVVTRKSPA